MDKTVTLILGLGQVVGEAIARRFHEDGHAVALADPAQKRLDRAEENLGEQATYHHENLHTKLGLRNAMAAASETYGHVDNIVVIPRIPDPAPLSDVDIEEFAKTHGQAMRGAVTLLKLFSKMVEARDELPGSSMERRTQKGSVTFILSLSAEQAYPGGFADSVTQHAMLGVVKAAAVELAPQLIRVNAICALRPRAEAAEPWLKTRTPLQRAALGDEIAEAALFLSRPRSAIITGEVMVMDGGRGRLGGVITENN